MRLRARSPRRGLNGNDAGSRCLPIDSDIELPIDSVVQMHDASFMNTFVPLRDWSAKTGSLLRELRKSGTLIVTQNGVPAAYVIKANPENIDADMAALNRLGFAQVTQRMRARARTAGADKMSLKAINAEIATVRSARRQVRQP